MEKWQIYVVPHTHWDKEWYFTKQDSDILLAQNIKNIKDVFTKNPKYKSFTYDGQASIIEDYLAYYQDKESILQLVKDKKLIIGPWYTQPDFFNTTSESIVRNLLYGINLAKEYGSNYLTTAYVPDSFGHNAQMPQIYKKFGLNNFLYWRGIRKKEIEQFGTYGKWKGIDGTTINSYNFLFGYWILGANFPYLDLNQNNIFDQAKTFLANFSATLTQLKANTKNTNQTLLLPLGGDQAPINQFTPEFFEAVNQLSDDQWILSDYDTYFQILEAVKASDEKLGELVNELKSPAFSRIHKTIGSQRVDIKQLMKEAETNLYDVLEPLAVYWKVMGGKYPIETINQAIKWILTSQAHDSAGGCNSDETNRDIANRLRKANDLILSETTRIEKQIAQIYQLVENDILIFNPKPYQLQKQIKLKVFTKFENFDLFNKGDIKLNFNVIKQIQHLAGAKVIGISKENGEISITNKGFYETEIVVDGIWKPMSFSFLKIQQRIDKKEVETETTKIAYDVTINSDGTINLFDKKKQINFEKQFKIYANEDGGDSYDYSPVTENNPEISKIVTSDYQILHQSATFLKLRVVNLYQLEKKAAQQLFTIDLEISHHDVINFSVKTQNVATGIRWRIVFDTNIKTKYSVANQAYHTITRLNELTNDLQDWQVEKWTEKPVSIETMESFIYLEDQAKKIGFITNGNNEYEIINDQEIHLTLYRSVLYLGQNNLLWRPGRASGTSEFFVKTKDASFLNKELQFKLAWFNVAKAENVWKLAQNTILKMPYYQVQSLNNLAKRFDRFIFHTEAGVDKKVKQLFTIDCPAFITKTIKLSWDQKGIIIRGFNDSWLTQTLKIWYGSQPIYFLLVDLLENRIAGQETTTQISIAPMEIGTYFISFNEINRLIK